MTLTFIVPLILVLIFFLNSKKVKWSKRLIRVFECGFTSYFYSRFSFSIHYYLVGIIFLFLDLELSFIMPFFNERFRCEGLMIYSWIFICILIFSLLIEWEKGKLEWNF